VVCYGFSEHHGDDLNYLNAVNARNQNILKKILESTTEAQAAGVRSTFLTSRSSNPEEHNFDLLRAGWSACMDAESRAKAGIKPLSDFVATINQTWPVSPEDLHTTVSVSDYDGLQKADQLLESVNIGALHKRCSTMTPDAVNPDPSNSVCCGVPSPIIFPTPVLTNVWTESQPRLH
jgi:endothelin-converting enzyme